MTRQTPDPKEPYVGKELGRVSFTVTEAVLHDYYDGLNLPPANPALRSSRWCCCLACSGVAIRFQLKSACREFPPLHSQRCVSSSDLPRLRCGRYISVFPSE